MLIIFEAQIELPIIRLDGLFERLEQVMDVIHGERRLTKDTHDFEDRPANLKVVLDNGNEAVGDDGHVYLYSDCIFRFSPETLDLEVLLDPFEEELHLPPIFIEQGNVLCAEVEVVRVVDEASMKPWRIIDNSSDNTGILLLILLLGEANGLVFEHVVCSIENTLAIDNLVSWLALLSDDKECPEYMDSVESGEVKVSSVKHIARQRLICEPVHRVDIVYLGVGDSIEHRNLRNDVNLSMDSDARLRASKLCPSEYGHAEVNGRGVNGIEFAMQFKLFCNASGLGNGHHVESELLKDTMVSESVGLRQHLSVDRLVAKSEVFRLLGMGGCYISEFPKASTAHKLTEHQNQQMVPMRHRPTLGPVVVFGEYAPELPLREKLYDLCKNECPYMHICSGFESDAKVSISKPGQGIAGLKRCA